MTGSIVFGIGSCTLPPLSIIPKFGGINSKGNNNYSWNILMFGWTGHLATTPCKKLVVHNFPDKITLIAQLWKLLEACTIIIFLPSAELYDP
jgi:hypothetical protein